MFVAVASAGTSRAMTSGKTEAQEFDVKNLFAGYVGIGDRTPDYALDVYGTICQDTNGDDICDGTVTSDRRLKKNIVNIGEALDKVSQLRGVNFEWDKSNSHTEFLGSGRQTGMIAQEVEELFPELVYEDMEGYKMIDYQKIVALNLEAIKELEAKNNILEQENGLIKEDLCFLGVERWC